MGDGILQSVLEVLGEVVLGGVLLVLVCVFVWVLATPFILIAAAWDRGRFWPSVLRRYLLTAQGVLKVFERIL
jgi:uncharacterized membrane protein YagU involved in acid resistance